MQEWQERKQMGEEDRKLLKYYLERETAIEQGRMEEETRGTREREIDKMWRAMQLEDAEEKKRIISQLMEAAGDPGHQRQEKEARW